MKSRFHKTKGFTELESFYDNMRQEIEKINSRYIPSHANREWRRSKYGRSMIAQAATAANALKRSWEPERLRLMRKMDKEILEEATIQSELNFINGGM